MPDVFVVGGGPAGLAAAIAARLKGLDVVVADAAQPPIDKACGEGLMPDSLDALRRLGISFDPGHSFVFRGIRFIGDGGRVAADFPRDPGIAVRRVRLHQLLIDRAEELGVELRWRTHASSFDNIRARWMIGADGQNSRVRRWADLDGARSESFRYGFRRHYRVRPWSDFMEIYWGPRCQMYVTPVGAGEACVALITRDPHQRMDAAMAHFPELARRLEGADITSSERGAITATRRLKRVCRGNVALIGDASGSVDAITGEGMSLAFRQSLVLADAIVAGDLHSYEIAHRQMARRPAYMAQLMLLLDRLPLGRPHVLRLFAAQPVIFERLLALHAGA
ncbi:MAG TPA: NAD(P)/FAD-dependent oxidoreductase [Bryobacteraceae bacterium]|nr:NAD(P)/FAD-dependent oxidoreductase [Bryobacteraceae bacterium]